MKTLEKILLAGALAASLSCSPKETEVKKEKPTAPLKYESQIIRQAKEQYMKDDDMYAETWIFAKAKIMFTCYLWIDNDKEYLKKAIDNSEKLRKLDSTDIRAPAILALANYMLGDTLKAREWLTIQKKIEKEKGVKYDWIFPDGDELTLRKEMYIVLEGYLKNEKTKTNN